MKLLRWCEKPMQKCPTRTLRDGVGHLASYLSWFMTNLRLELEIEGLGRQRPQVVAHA